MSKPESTPASSVVKADDQPNESSFQTSEGSTASPEGTSSPEAKPNVPKAWLIFQRASRLALIGVVIWAVWYGIEGYRVMFAPVKSSEEMVEEVSPKLVVSPVESLMRFNEPASWTFFGAPWDVQIGMRTTEELAFALAAPPQISSETLPEKNHQDDEGLIHTIQQLQPEVEEFDDYRVYQVSQGSLRLRLLTTNDNQPERMLALRIAFPKEDQWMLMEGVPGVHGETSFQGNPLLPHPPEAKVLCRRTTTKGETNTEFVLVTQDLPELVSLWEEQGWTMEYPPEWQGGSRTQWTCTKGEQEVQVSAHPQDGNPHRWMLFLVKSYAKSMVNKPKS